MIEITLGHYLTLGAIFFSIGIVGIFLNRKNVIIILMCIELILLAVNINLVSFSIYLQNLTGQIFTMFILTVAAAEAAVGLAIIIMYYKNKGSIDVDQISSLKG
tara:strand:+ start:42 stop:353 length:312 start_codon:yes stop_codon:yes gene_type:complete